MWCLSFLIDKISEIRNRRKNNTIAKGKRTNSDLLNATHKTKDWTTNVPRGKAGFTTLLSPVVLLYCIVSSEITTHLQFLHGDIRTQIDTTFQNMVQFWLYQEEPLGTFHH